MERYMWYTTFKRELKGHMCVCEKKLAMESDRKNPTCL